MMKDLKRLIGVAIVGAMLFPACSESDNSGGTNKPNDDDKDCVLSDYAAVGDMIYKICNYIERCDKSIYTLYHNDLYPNGYVDQCHCNAYMNDQLDDPENQSRKDAYDSFTMIGEAWNDECNDYPTGTLKAKLKYLFE